MTSVYSYSTVQGLIKRIKDLKRGYLTNFFPDISKMNLLIQKNLIFYEEFDRSVFLCREKKDFYSLFFITTNDAESFAKDLSLFLQKHSEVTFVVDVIARANDVGNAINVLIDNGFFKYTSLVRMSKILSEDFIENIDLTNLYFSDMAHANEIFELLHSYFDPFAEQLPMIEEIHSWISRNGIVIYSDDNKLIQGFLIFELTGQTSYLRYWFVLPDQREKRIGSTLLHKFFSDSKGATRHLFWVIESNENAIKRYEHFGFRKEELFDYIMINKNIIYEG